MSDAARLLLLQIGAQREVRKAGPLGLYPVFSSQSPLCAGTQEGRRAA